MFDAATPTGGCFRQRRLVKTPPVPADLLYLNVMRAARPSLHRQLQCPVSAADTSTGAFVLIPRFEVLSWHSDLRDWRRVSIVWNGMRYVVSRSAWENAAPVQPAVSRHERA
jgi:hypothetical protein